MWLRPMSVFVFGTSMETVAIVATRIKAGGASLLLSNEILLHRRRICSVMLLSHGARIYRRSTKRAQQTLSG
jgi:hypothetical protein